MRLAQLRQPLRAVAGGGSFWSSGLALAWTTTHRPELPLFSATTPRRLEDGNRAVEGRRNAHVKSAGAYRIPNKKTLPKKMGAKKTGDQFVIPGNIIFKQRGTIWHPGDNVIMGRDHTIHAAIEGYVKYYRDPARNPEKQYIGVAFSRDDTLPYPAHGVRRRKLNMVAVPRREPAPLPALSPSGLPTRVIRKADNIGFDPTKPPKSAYAAAQRQITIRRSNRVLLLQKDYSYRESNAAIGRLMGKWNGRTAGLGEPRGKRVRIKAMKTASERGMRKRAKLDAAEAAEREAAEKKAAEKAAKLAERAAAAAEKAKAKAKEQHAANMLAAKGGGPAGGGDLRA